MADIIGFESTLPNCGGTSLSIDGKVYMYTYNIWSQMIADDLITRDVATRQIVDIQNAPGEAAVEIGINKEGIQPSTPAVIGDSQSGHTHTLRLVIPTLTQEQKEQYTSFLCKPVICIVRYENSEEPFAMVYGDGSGLRATVLDNIQTDQQLANAIDVTLSTHAKVTLEPTMPNNIDAGGRTPTMELLDTLTTPGV